MTNLKRNLNQLTAKEDKENYKKQQRIRLYNALKNIDKSIADIYLESIKILNESRNNVRFAFSAHGIRILIDIIPDTIKIPTKHLKQKRSNKINNLIEVFKKNIIQTSCKINNSFKGEIDNYVRKILKVSGVIIFPSVGSKGFPTRFSYLAL